MEGEVGYQQSLTYLYIRLVNPSWHIHQTKDSFCDIHSTSQRGDWACLLVDGSRARVVPNICPPRRWRSYIQAIVVAREMPGEQRVITAVRAVGPEAGMLGKGIIHGCGEALKLRLLLLGAFHWWQAGRCFDWGLKYETCCSMESTFWSSRGLEYMKCAVQLSLLVHKFDLPNILLFWCRIFVYDLTWKILFGWTLEFMPFVVLMTHYLHTSTTTPYL